MNEIKPLKQIRKEHIERVLSTARGDLERASRLLGLKPSALLKSMKELGINCPERGSKGREG